jgi:transposase
VPFRSHPPPTPLLFGYDPVRDLPQDHLARLVEQVVEESLATSYRPNTPGQPTFDPRLCAKVLLYGYATGVRSSRLLERHCNESLAYLFLTRGDTPSYRTLCSFRVEHADLIETVWVGMFAVAEQAGMKRLGRIVIDSTKMHADAGPEAVVKADEYEAVLKELQSILNEAQATDTSEDNQAPGSTLLGKSVPREQMRDILRRVRKQQGQHKASASKDKNDPPPAPPTQELPEAPKTQEPAPSPTSPMLSEQATDTPIERPPLGPRMLARITTAIQTIQDAQKEQQKHACLTDPDARMMGEGREKRIRECHSFEVAVDNALLVVGQSCQSPVDNPRLLPLVEAARLQEPDGLVAVDSDSGYYAGDAIFSLLAEGLDVCIPDAHTACDLHRGVAIGTNRAKSAGSLEMTYDPTANHYTCPHGNVLAYQHTVANAGQQMRVYQAQSSCQECPLRGACGLQAKSKYRTISVGTHSQELRAHLGRFAEAEHVERYRQRAPMVETVFGCLRALLSYGRWMLRGKVRVAAEARLFTAALQIRKIHTQRCAG